MRHNDQESRVKEQLEILRKQEFELKCQSENYETKKIHANNELRMIKSGTERLEEVKDKAEILNQERE